MICDGMKNNCKGDFDEGIPTSTWYSDSDGDGFGNPDNYFESCFQQFGYVASGTDCDDYDPNIYPGAIEYCNGMDEDCNGQIDDNPVGGTTWYRDADADGYGSPSFTVTACIAPPGYVAGNSDCNDANSNIHPGATEICGNGIDDNCDGQTDELGCL